VRKPTYKILTPETSLDALFICNSIGIKGGGATDLPLLVTIISLVHWSNFDHKSASRSVTDIPLLVRVRVGGTSVSTLSCGSIFLVDTLSADILLNNLKYMAAE